MRIQLSTVAILSLLLSLGPAALQSAESPKTGKILYDTKANAAEQIKAALEKARQENKNIILKFGANWCGWCHLLSDLFKEDAEISKTLNQNFVLVLIDVDKGHNDDVVKRYGNPTQHGLPVLVVLDPTGKQLHTQDTALLEAGKRHDPAKVKAFLAKWKPSKR